jgi:hypothetical protein
MHGKLLVHMTFDPLTAGLREELVTAALEAQSGERSMSRKPGRS